MGKKEYDRVNSLKNMAVAKSAQTFFKVNNAINEMEKNSIALTFQSVAKTAKVSKTWLYSNKEISERIRNNREQQGSIRKMLDSAATITSRDKQIEDLKKRVVTMTKEIKILKSQLETAYAELYKR